MRVRIRILAMLMLTAAMVTMISPALAQQPFVENVLVQVYSNQAGGTITSVFTPAAAGIFRLPQDGSNKTEISRDGLWAASSDFQNFINFGQINAPRTQLKLYQGYSMTGFKFSSDSRWLLYSLSSLQPARTLIGMLELATGKKLEFVAVADDFSPFGPRKSAAPIDYDGHRMLVYAFTPFSEGGFGGIFAMPLPDLTPYGADQYGMPPVSLLVGENNAVVNWQVAPDNSRLALLYNDPNNPVQGFVGEGPMLPANILASVNLTTGQIDVLARAGVGQALSVMTWTSDSTRILFTGGNYQNSSFLVYAKMYVVSVLNGMVSEVGPSVSEPTQYFTQMLSCGTVLYSVVDRSTQGGIAPQSLLLSSPLVSPTSYTVLGSSPSGYSLQQCTGLS
ncbi:MAG: hypothetical protein KF716_20300 [Anaerolineae bacterium]|nr:hypothetical protein [Anaerolineae bacterium]